MKARIEAHREARPPHWDTLEEPVDLVAALAPLLHRYDTVLLDCLTLWGQQPAVERKRPWRRPGITSSRKPKDC